jgi:hypothetical protein
MGRRRKQEFYYHAAAYKDKALSDRVYQELDSLIMSTDYDLSIHRYLIPAPRLYCVVVIGEEPSEALDKKIFIHLDSTGTMIGMPPDILRDFLRQTHMN